MATGLILEDVGMKNNSEIEKTLSEVINMDMINALDKNTIHLIPAPAGSGKTYFAVEVIIKDALAKGKKVLLLSSRSSLNQQTKADVIRSTDRHGFGERLIEDLVETPGIDVKTYQRLAIDIGARRTIPDYDYIICDEAHYFIADAKFNKSTIIAFNYLTKAKGLKLFLTATPFIFGFLDYKIQTMFDCNDVGLISSTKPVNINFTYDMTKHLSKEMFDENNKLIVFGQRVRKLRALAQHFDAEENIILSKWNEDHKDINNVGLIDDIVKDGLFEQNILLSTMAHNVGLNIHENIKVIGIAGLHTDIDIVQSINRARKQSVNLVVEKLRKRDLERIVQKNNQELKWIEMFRQERFKELDEEIDINVCKWVYDIFIEETNEYIKLINPMYEANLLYENCILNFILKYGQFEYYKKMFPEAKQVDVMDTEFFENQRKKNFAREGVKNQMALYVIDYLFKTLNKDEQQEFRQGFHQFDGFGRKDRMPGLSVINKKIEPLGYTVTSERSGTAQEKVWKIAFK